VLNWEVRQEELASEARATVGKWAEGGRVCSSLAVLLKMLQTCLGTPFGRLRQPGQGQRGQQSVTSAALGL